MTAGAIPKDPYPSQKLWDYRTDWFSWAMGEALGKGNLAGVSTRHARVLEQELETVFCAGAWYATIVFACAAAEVYLKGQDVSREAKFLGDFGLRDDWIWIVNRRNAIVHPTKNSPDDPSAMNYVQPDLEDEAKRAVQFALMVLLLGTREKLPSSLERKPDESIDGTE